VWSKREREVIILFFGIGSGTPLSLEDIGERFVLTRERVRQIKDKGLLHLRQRALKNKRLESYL